MLSTADATSTPSGVIAPVGPKIIKELSEQTIRKAGLWGQIPVPLNRIADSLGYVCMEFDSGGNVSDVLGAIDYKHVTIWVNKSQALNRKRFTIAHEIGHAVLHPNEDIVDYRVDFEKPRNLKEVQANKFAAELLMPEEFFRSKWTACGGNKAIVAAFFAVSSDAAGYRAQNLGL